MASYFIGDLHGCYNELVKILDKISYDSNKDKLLFTGDLVGRGPYPLKALNLVRSLQQNSSEVRVVLGNHDLHLITVYFGGYDRNKNRDKTLEQVLDADNAAELIEWLLYQPLMYWNKQENYVLVHAGIPHIWNLKQAQALARQTESKLKKVYKKVYKGEHDGEFARLINNTADAKEKKPQTIVHEDYKAKYKLKKELSSVQEKINNNTHRQNAMMHLMSGLYGNQPDILSKATNEIEQLRVIINYFTRMRLCSNKGSLELSYKGAIGSAPPGYAPWFSYPRKEKKCLIVFGHWAALNGKSGYHNMLALDYGCVWGAALAAKRLEDGKTFKVKCGK